MMFLLKLKVQGYKFFISHLKMTFKYAWQTFCINRVVYLQLEE